MKKRVLMLSTLHSHDDIRIYYKEAAALRRAGYAVCIACPGEPPAGLGVKTMALCPPRRRVARMAVGWLCGLRAGVASGAKAVHIHDPELIPAGLLLRALGKRVVYDAHEDLPRQIAHKAYLPGAVKPALSRLAEWGEGWAARHFDMVIGATPQIARRLGGVTVRNLSDQRELFIPKLSQKADQVCYIGAISEARGIFPMIEAARLSGTHLMIAGACEDAALRRSLEEHPFKESFTLLGQISRPAVGELLAQSACGLCVLSDTPAYREAIPVKLLEYMMAGLPFVASDFPGWRDIGGRAGLYVRPGDARAIAEAIRRLTGDADLAARMGAEGKRRAAMLSFEAEEEKLIRAYQSLWERH